MAKYTAMFLLDFRTPDTVHRAWNDTSLVTAFCDAALMDQKKAIVDTLVFTHSSGNLIFARGLDLEFVF